MERSKYRTFAEKPNIMYEERIARAAEYHQEGYNCCQSVVLAVGDLYGCTQEQSLKMSAAFGGGIGGMRDICGAAMGMFMLAGLETGSVRPKDAEGKKRTFGLVQELAEEFKKRNGALRCADLLNLPKAPTPQTPNPDAQGNYYLNSCTEKVRIAAELWCQALNKLRA